MLHKRLTNSMVEKFQFPLGATTRTGKPITQAVLWCGETKGFGVRISQAGNTRTYFLQYRVKGSKQERMITIGRHCDPYRVDQARAKALELKAQMLGGTDPVEERARVRDAKRRQVANGTTLRQTLEHYLTHKVTKHGPLRPATQQDMRYHAEKNLTAWLDLPIASITRDRCLEKFTEITTRAPQQANACMVYLRALCNYAREMHATDDGQFPVLAVNPVTRMFKLRKPNPERPKDTRIPLDKIGACWNLLRQRSANARTENDRCAPDWLCFMLLTGTRRGEAGSLKWSDVDFDNNTITFRADVVKNHSAFTIPMSGVLRDLLLSRQKPMTDRDVVIRRRKVKRSTEYVFASNGPKIPYITNAQASLEALSKTACTHVHLHSLRRTFDDIASECGVDGDKRRILLNHIGGDVHSRHYSNNARALGAVVESIAHWILRYASIAEVQATGAIVVQLMQHRV